MVLSIAGVTALILAWDALFRQSLPGWYAQSFAHPQTTDLMLASVIEEVKFRLILLTALIGVLTLMRLNSVAWIATAIVLAQAVNVGPMLYLYPAWSIGRFLAAGCVWGWLYWRHGWATAALAHSSTHLVLDPLLSAELSA